MPDPSSDALTDLSHALARRCEAAAPSLITVLPGHRAQRSGFLWQNGVAITAEQDLPREAEVAILSAGGARQMARVGGRDNGTNVAVLRLEAVGAAPEAVTPGAGSLALAFGSQGGQPTVRLGTVHHVGPAWDSLAGGRIDQDIRLDLRLTAADEGGPVMTPAGGLIGMATIGARGRAIAIPAATLSRAVALLLERGSGGNGWLGVGLQPVGLPTALRECAGREAGLMVVGLASGGPAEQAGLLPGDILLDVGGEATRHPRAVARALKFVGIGQTIDLRLLRGGAPLSVQATVATRPAA